MLEKANDGSKNVDIGIEWPLGQERCDGIGDTETIDGSFAALVHVVENGIASDKI